MLLMLRFRPAELWQVVNLLGTELTYPSRERKGMPPRSSIGKRIVRRPASYEEEPDTDDGEHLARVIVGTFALVAKMGPPPSSIKLSLL